MDISNLIIYQSIFFGKRIVINSGRAKRHLMLSFATEARHPRAEARGELSGHSGRFL